MYIENYVWDIQSGLHLVRSVYIWSGNSEWILGVCFMFHKMYSFDSGIPAHCEEIKLLYKSGLQRIPNLLRLLVLKFKVQVWVLLSQLSVQILGTEVRFPGNGQVLWMRTEKRTPIWMLYEEVQLAQLSGYY